MTPDPTSSGTCVRVSGSGRDGRRSSALRHETGELERVPKESLLSTVENDGTPNSGARSLQSPEKILTGPQSGSDSPVFYFIVPVSS